MVVSRGVARSKNRADLAQASYVPLWYPHSLAKILHHHRGSESPHPQSPPPCHTPHGLHPPPLLWRHPPEFRLQLNLRAERQSPTPRPLPSQRRCLRARGTPRVCPKDQPTMAVVAAPAPRPETLAQTAGDALETRPLHSLHHPRPRHWQARPKARQPPATMPQPTGRPGKLQPSQRQIHPARLPEGKSVEGAAVARSPRWRVSCAPLLLTTRSVTRSVARVKSKIDKWV